MTAWYIVSSVLGVIWIIAAVIGCGVAIWSTFEYSEFPVVEFQIFAAVMAGALVIVFLHWIVLLLLVPAFVIYGLVAGIKLLIKRPWREDAHV